MARKRKPAPSSPRKTRETTAAKKTTVEKPSPTKRSKKKTTKKGKANMSGLASAWKSAQKTKPSSGLELPDIPDGTFCGKLSAAAYGFKKNPWFRIEFTLTHGEYEGTQLTKLYTLTGDVINQETGTTQMDLFSMDLQRLGIDVESLEFEDIQNSLATFLIDPEQNEHAESCWELVVRNKEDRQGRRRLNIYINGALTDDEVDDWEDKIDDTEESEE